MVDVIGIVSGVLGIVSFIQGNIPSQPDEGAAVRIKAGSGGTDDEGSVSNKNLSNSGPTNINPRAVTSQLFMPGTLTTTISAEATGALWSKEE